MSDLGGRIKERRLAIGMNQQTLALRIDRTQGFVSRIEQGKNVPPIQLIQEIAQVLQTTVAYLTQSEANDGEVEAGRQILRELSQRYEQGESREMIRIIEQARELRYFHQPEQAIQLDFWLARAWRIGGHYDQSLEVLASWVGREQEIPAYRYAELLYLYGQALRLTANPSRILDRNAQYTPHQQVQKALEYLLRSEALWAELGDFVGTRVRVSVPIEIGLCYSELGAIDQSNESFQTALALIDKELRYYFNRQGLAELSLGVNEVGRNNSSGAIRHYENALALYSKSQSDTVRLVILLNNLGSAYDDTGDRQRAFEMFQMAYQTALTHDLQDMAKDVARSARHSHFDVIAGTDLL